MDVRPYARPGSGPPFYATRVRTSMASLPTMASSDPGLATEPDLDLPWVTAYLVDDAEPATPPSWPLQVSSVLAEAPTPPADVSSTPNYNMVVENWLLQDTAAKLSEFSANPQAFVRANVRDRAHSTPMFAWRDEDLPVTMSVARPNGYDSCDSEAVTVVTGLSGTAEVAACALESLATRVRAGHLHLPRQTSDLSEAAVLAAVLLALLSMPQ